jgi:hypothetical protein
MPDEEEMITAVAHAGQIDCRQRRAAILPYPDDRQLGWVVTAASAPVWEETLRDGRVVALRPLRSDDAAEVEALWRRLDAPSRRLFTNLAHLPPDRPGDVAVPRPRR